MARRSIIFGKKIKELDHSVDLTIHTKCPEKWILIDLETLQVYRGRQKADSYGKWKGIFNPKW